MSFYEPPEPPPDKQPEEKPKPPPKEDKKSNESYETGRTGQEAKVTIAHTVNEG